MSEFIDEEFDPTLNGDPMLNWREKMIAYTNNPAEIELLMEGPKSLSQSWHLQALQNKYKKIFNIK